MSVRGAAAWAIAGQYLSFAIQFAASVVISRLFLSPGEVGLFSIGLAAALLAAILQDFGLTRYVAGLETIDAAAIARCSSVALLFSIAVAGVIAAAAGPMARAYHQPGLLPIMLIIAASYLLLPLAVVPLALMGRRMAFHGHFAVNVGGALAQAAVAVTLAALGFSSFALAWGTLASGAARGLIAQALRPALPWPLRLDGIRPIVGSGSRLSTLYLTGALGTRTPDLVVGKLLGVVAVGLYSRAVSLSDQFRMLISGAIGSVFFPAFARIRDRGEPLGPAYLRVAAGYSAVIWPGMAGLALAAAPVVRLLYGPAWAGVAPPLQLIAVTELMLVALPLHIDLPILLGRLDRLLLVNIVDTLLSVTFLAVGCHWGIAGAAASRLVYGVGWLCLYAGFLHRLVGFDARALLAIYLRSALATLAALAPLVATYRFIAGPGAIGIGYLVLSTILGAVAWLAMLMLTRHPAAGELAGLACEAAAAFTRPRRSGAAADPVV
ncbi:MAG: oligosaccharide flippase family protein [Novosphingobium sp.]|nr:oligosaccharide flippase family protein [Novosphingobium sp.]